MKSFKSLSDVTRAAAELGASVNVGGRAINAQGARLTVARSNFAAASPAPAPEQADHAERFAQLLQTQAQLMAAQGQAMGDVLVRMLDHLERAAVAPVPPPAAAAPQAQKARPIRFDVVRQGASVSLVPMFGAGNAATPKTYDLQRDAAGRLLSVIPVYH